ncbi:MAG: endonuclease III [Actinobacteria bacterium]|nr:endonuclease III [Actinomycetota bacterium]
MKAPAGKGFVNDAKSDELERRLEILSRLNETYPGSNQELCALKFSSPFQLLVATILSAQCTDERVNLTTPSLFAKYPTAKEMALARVDEIEQIIYSTGFYKNKARNISKMASQVLSVNGGRIPDNLEDLVKLPGVGRKTANVILSVGFGKPGLAVDTHVGRLARRLGLTCSKDPVRIEKDLMEWVPPPATGGFSLRLIIHGRRVCFARKPNCSVCVLCDLCPSAFN